MILDAYNNPKTSAKFEQQIGELMIRTIRKEHDRIKQYKPDNHLRQTKSAPTLCESAA